MLCQPNQGIQGNRGKNQGNGFHLVREIGIFIGIQKIANIIQLTELLENPYLYLLIS